MIWLIIIFASLILSFVVALVWIVAEYKGWQRGFAKATEIDDVHIEQLNKLIDRLNKRQGS